VNAGEALVTCAVVFVILMAMLILSGCAYMDEREEPLLVTVKTRMVECKNPLVTIDSTGRTEDTVSSLVTGSAAQMVAP
jgi:hypothetical protein